MFLGLRTTIYPAPDLAASKAWFTRTLGIEPYFDEPFYVGFNVAGYELGLQPDADTGEAVTYWGVADADMALAHLSESGAEVYGAVQEVGEGIRVATVRLPHDGGLLGIIENPHFQLPETAEDSGAGGAGR